MSLVQHTYSSIASVHQNVHPNLPSPRTRPFCVMGTPLCQWRCSRTAFHYLTLPHSRMTVLLCSSPCLGMESHALYTRTTFLTWASQCFSHIHNSAQLSLLYLALYIRTAFRTAFMLPYLRTYSHSLPHSMSQNGLLHFVLKNNFPTST
jgi:hypothetical protein